MFKVSYILFYIWSFCCMCECSIKSQPCPRHIQILRAQHRASDWCSLSRTSELCFAFLTCMAQLQRHVPVTFGWTIAGATGGRCLGVRGLKLDEPTEQKKTEAVFHTTYVAQQKDCVQENSPLWYVFLSILYIQTFTCGVPQGLSFPFCWSPSQLWTRDRLTDGYHP